MTALGDFDPILIMQKQDDVAAAIKKVAGVACEVSPCDGTTRKPCTKHKKAAQKFVYDCLAPFDPTVAEQH